MAKGKTKDVVETIAQGERKERDPMDAELAAMNKVSKVLRPLDFSARARVLAWSQARFAAPQTFGGSVSPAPKPLSGLPQSPPASEYEADSDHGEAFPQ